MSGPAMQIGLLAFSTASAFLGAALYINVVEQPARLALGPQSSVKEWALSNRRGFLMLSAMAILSATLAYAQYVRTGDVRWIIGGTVNLANLPYTYFVVTPVNIWLCAIPPGGPRSPARELLRDWGLLEWGQTTISLAACGFHGWALALPAQAPP